MAVHHVLADPASLTTFYISSWNRKKIILNKNYLKASGWILGDFNWKKDAVDSFGLKKKNYTHIYTQK